ncbi:acetolactate synthase 2 catalytic subunit [Gynuella sp.]|uniref:acetolactate synthase 2 catalytic subunit n=1 Tax=Gynuella sp. TaxID=2969146 RepID=UPI003D0D7361
MNGAQYILKTLQEQSIRTLFGYPGGCIMPLYDALVDSNLEHVLCRHEQAAALAANGYARASGGLGVVVATSGPGATNLMTGIADAFMDSIPVLVITGQVSSHLIGSDAFQEVDVLGMTMAIVKHSYLVTSADELESIIIEAIHLATSGRPGPVWIDIAKDALMGEMPPESASKPTNYHENKHNVDQASLQNAIEIIRQAQRPLLYSGGGVMSANALDEFRAFANQLNIPHVVSLKGIGNPGLYGALNLGMLGMHGSRACNELIEQCDALIAIGVRFDDRATGAVEHFATNANIIHIDIDPAEFHKNKRVSCTLRGEMKSILQQLTTAFSSTLNIQTWRNHCRATKHQKGLIPQNLSTDSNNIAGPEFLTALSAVKKTRSVISCDVGQHQMWVAQYVDFDHPRQHLSSGGLGTMGFGLPAAIGACFARPDAQIINISGDGSFMMNIQELATIRRHQLPVKIIILDNQHLGLVRQQQELFYQGRYSAVDLSDNPDFTEIARVFGFHALQIHNRSQIGPALDTLLSCQGPAMLQVHINTDSNVWPMVKPGGANHEMLEPEQIKGSAA